MTQTSAVIGTAQYLSPEQARGEAVDARSDVYAAGCVLFELLCGHPPFVGDSPVSVAYQHVREDPKPPSYINPEVPPDVDAVVLKALAKNPLNRYQSAAEMRADVLRAAAGRAVMATPVMSEAETMAMAAATQVRPMGGPPTRPVARVGDARRRRASAWVLAALSALGVLAVVALVAGLLLSNQDQEQKVTVPTVENLTQPIAEQQLRAAKLVPTIGEPDKSAGCRKGIVTTQNPDPGTELNEGDTVTINVCTGPDTVQVPSNLAGKSYAAVADALTKLGLTPQENPVDSAKPEGEVTEVERAGETVEKGATIKVSVSRGNRATVPNVVGLDQDVAEDRLRRAGFIPQVVPGEPSAENAGEVVDQDPNGDEEARKDSRVRIVVAREPEQPPEPTDDPEPTATATEGTGG
jgi:serine/threonine-protein kinase